MFWSDLVFGQKQGGNYEKPSRVSRLAAGAADARLLRPRQRAGKESIDAEDRGCHVGNPGNPHITQAGIIT